MALSGFVIWRGYNRRGITAVLMAYTAMAGVNAPLSTDLTIRFMVLVIRECWCVKSSVAVN